MKTLNHPFQDETDCPHSSSYIEDRRSDDDNDTKAEYDDSLYGAI